jgi:sulfur-oxidizing protein SoxZ
MPPRSDSSAGGSSAITSKAKRGEIIGIKVLISHNMETGFRYTSDGKRIERDIVHTFVASYNGDEIFRAELHPAVSANPFLAFHTVATESGTIEFRWLGDNGLTARETAKINVE